MVPCAQLKVFTPLDAFPAPERERWAAYVQAGHGLTRREVAAQEEQDSVRLLMGGAPRGQDAALVRRAGRRILVCPLQMDLRAAVALEAFRRTVPPFLADAFVPDAARSRLDHLSASGRAPHILDEAWAVPLHWFIAFGPDERHFTDPAEGSGPRISYLTTVGQAVARLEQAIEVVEATLEDGDDVLAALAGIAAWLDGFEETSVLELDYGTVARSFRREELAADRTCEELWQAVEALEAGDLLGAAAFYGVARARWTHRRAIQHAS